MFLKKRDLEPTEENIIDTFLRTVLEEIIAYLSL